MAAQGTKLHELASNLIKLGVNLPKTETTLNMFVNDAIGFKMQSEQILAYSENAFGSADAICFRDNLLRIHDLKMGVTPTSMTQLKIYAAFFCLEYHVDPNAIDIELRIYQNNERIIEEPTKEDILYIMDKIVRYDLLLEKLKSEG